MKTMKCHVYSQIAALHFPARHVTICCFLNSPSFPIQSILSIVPLGNISSVFSLSPLTSVTLNLVPSSAGNRQEADNKAQNLFMFGQYILKDLSLAIFSFIIIFKIKCLKTLHTLLICQVMFKFLFRRTSLCAFLTSTSCYVTFKNNANHVPSIPRASHVINFCLV